MGEVLACRMCLATHVKLFNMFEYRLDACYENLTGFQLTREDYIQHACSTCSVLLVKSSSFKQMCQNSQDLLEFAVIQEHLISTEYIESLKIVSLQKLTVEINNSIIECVHEENEAHEENEPYEENEPVKEETDYTYSNAWDNEDLLSAKEESSDEEPLSAIITAKSKNIEEEENKSAPKNKSNDKPLLNINNDEKPKNRNNDEITKTRNNHGKTKNRNNVKKTKTRNNGEKTRNRNNDEIEENYSDHDDDNDFDDAEIDVVVLTKEQQIEEVLSRKTSLNYINSFYKCDHCFKGFITDSTYKNHIVRHDPSFGPHECEVCHTRWSTASRLRTHVNAAHEKKYVCRLCNAVTRSKYQAKGHSMWHHGHTFICKFCGASFSKSTSHLTHLRLQHPSKHTCNICGESFLGNNGLKQHKKKAHWDKKALPKSDSCCPHCNIEFQTVEAYKRHISDSKNKPCDPSLRPCVQCGETLKTEEELKKHLKNHSKEEPITCGECSRTFAHERSYSLHYQRTHMGRVSKTSRDPPPNPHVVCEISGKKCMSNATLRYHQRTHTGEKPYQCSECPKRFIVLQRLQIHQRTHTGERPYVCNVCPKAFKHKAALNRHLRVHTGAKPYSCSHCGKAFSQSNSMKGHIKTVHLKMPSPYRPRRVPVE